MKKMIPFKVSQEAIIDILFLCFIQSCMNWAREPIYSEQGICFSEK